jgi:hypothetical protein
VLTVLTLIVVGSDARAIGIFAASATGAETFRPARSPVNLARVLRRVPESTFFIQLATASLLPASADESRSNAWLSSSVS